MADYGGSNSVDVLLTVRDRVAVSTPVVGGGPEPGWKVRVRAGATVLVTTTRPVEATYLPADGEGTPAHWSVVWIADDAEGTRTEVCDPGTCAGVALSIERTGGSHVVLEEHVNGPNVTWPSGGDMTLGHGAISLHPRRGRGPGGVWGRSAVLRGELRSDDEPVPLRTGRGAVVVADGRAQGAGGRRSFLRRHEGAGTGPVGPSRSISMPPPRIRPTPGGPRRRPARSSAGPTTGAPRCRPRAARWWSTTARSRRRSTRRRTAATPPPRPTSGRQAPRSPTSRPDRIRSTSTRPTPTEAGSTPTPSPTWRGGSRPDSERIWGSSSGS